MISFDSQRSVFIQLSPFQRQPLLQPTALEEKIGHWQMWCRWAWWDFHVMLWWLCWDVDVGFPIPEWLSDFPREESVGAGSAGLLSHTKLSVAVLHTFSRDNLADQSVSDNPSTVVWDATILATGKLPTKLHANPFSNSKASSCSMFFFFIYLIWAASSANRSWLPMEYKGWLIVRDGWGYDLKAAVISCFITNPNCCFLAGLSPLQTMVFFPAETPQVWLMVH